MADIDDRWHRTEIDPTSGERRKVRSARYGTGKRYAARWRDDHNLQRSRSFDTVRDATSWLAKVAVDLSRGEYVDPTAGKVRLKPYAEQWLANQTFDESTREAVASRLRLHVFPQLGSYELRALAARPSVVQAWTRGLQGAMAPNTVRVVFANLSAVLSAAVEDNLIARNPCRTAAAKPPAKPAGKVVPWTPARLAAVRETLPDRYREIATVGAGVGLRQGEIFGLAVEDVDFLRQVVHVRRQVKIVGSRLVFSEPKRGKQRDVPLAQSVAFRLSAQLQAWPAQSVTLPWKSPVGKATTVQLLFTTREHKAINRNYFNDGVWKPALKAAGVAPTRENGCHALRHFYASTVLDGGTSIRELADWLGHTDPGFTLRTYTHLLPAGSERMRGAVDAALSGESINGPSTGGAPDVRHTLG
jgi:integrase